MESDDSEWQNYWAKKESRFIYDLIAEFYRRFIIRPSLTRVIKKYFKKNDKILHAGCGSGQVDTQLHSYVEITALDISSNALKIYKNENGQQCKTILGSIFSIPNDGIQYDGVYNLGVMEHFSEEAIKNILLEFRRVIKVNGHIVLFWPPTYGLSVRFFRMLTKVLHLITGKHFTFHPTEISQLQSRSHAIKLLQGSGFQLVEYAFGIKDLFTYVVVVAKAI